MHTSENQTVQKKALELPPVTCVGSPMHGRSRPVVVDKAACRTSSQACEIDDNNSVANDTEPEPSRAIDNPTGAENSATKVFPSTIGLVALYEELRSVRELLGGIEDTEWTGRAQKVVAAALNARERYLAASTAEQEALRARIKKDGNRSRGPNEHNVDLIALNCAVTAKGKEEQKAWSRLANVVKVAASDRVTAERVGEFLRANNLTRCLERARALKGSTKDRKPAPPKLLKSYPPLIEAWRVGDLDALLAKLSKEVETAGAATVDGKAA